MVLPAMKTLVTPEARMPAVVFDTIWLLKITCAVEVDEPGERSDTGLVAGDEVRPRHVVAAEDAAAGYTCRVVEDVLAGQGSTLHLDSEDVLENVVRSRAGRK